MANQKQDQEKKNLVIIDFDGTIFYNPTNNFSLNMPLNHALDAYSFFNEFTFQTNKNLSNNAEIILVTGRHKDQETVIRDLLELKGYKFDQYFFNQMDRTTVIDEKSFLIKYWTAKVKLINEFRLNNEYKSIVIIDDDTIICSMLQKLNFEAYRVEINKESLTQTLSIAFNSPQKRLMTELQGICV